MPQPHRLPARRREQWGMITLEDDRRRPGRNRVQFVLRDGRWYELLDDHRSVPAPGARNLTAEEYVGPEAREVQRYGRWIQIPYAIAQRDSDLLQWCRQHGEQLQSG